MRPGRHTSAYVGARRGPLLARSGHQTNGGFWPEALIGFSVNLLAIVGCQLAAEDREMAGGTVALDRRRILERLEIFGLAQSGRSRLPRVQDDLTDLGPFRYGGLAAALPLDVQLDR